MVTSVNSSEIIREFLCFGTLDSLIDSSPTVSFFCWVVVVGLKVKIGYGTSWWSCVKLYHTFITNL